MITFLRCIAERQLARVIAWPRWGWPATKRLMQLRHKVDPNRWCESCKQWVPSRDAVRHMHLTQ